MIESAMKAGQDKNIGHEYRKDTESRYREDHRTIVPSPWPAINELIQGGLGNGDLGLIFGSPGGGKSWTLVALGGFLCSLGSLVKQLKPTSIYIIFDGVGSSINRKNLLPEYKSGTNVNRVNKTSFDSVEVMVACLPGSCPP